MQRRIRTRQNKTSEFLKRSYFYDRVCSVRKDLFCYDDRNTKMNVILLAPTPPPYGGIASWTNRILKIKLKNDWKILLVDEKLSGKRGVFSNVKKNYIVEVKRCFRIWSDLIRALRNKDAKVVHICIPASSTSMLREFVSAVIAKWRCRKVLVHFRCTLPNMVKSRTTKIIFKILASFCDYIVVLNRASSDFVAKVAPNKKNSIIPNFVDIDLTRSKKHFPTLTRLVYVGGVIPEKGCDLIAKVASRLPNKEFRLIGEVGMDASLFPPNVTLLGSKSKEFVRKELEDADVFLFLSRFSAEGFSNALVEAMASSLPCIVSNWAANLDMIENMGGGIVLSEYNEDKVLEAIEALEPQKIREQMGNWNRIKVSEHYSDTVVPDMYVDVYESLIR